MGLIKDIIDANSIEQKRRLANRLPIDMEDKNSLINNKNGGEGGGSGSGSGSGVEYTYLDVRGFDMGSIPGFLNILPFASFINYKGVLNGQDIHYIMSYGYYGFLNGDISSILGLAIDESFMATNMKTPDSEQLCSIKEAIEMSTAKDLYNSIPRLTKEEFYNLEA